MNVIPPTQQQLGLNVPQMNKYTMSGTTSIGILAGAILGPFFFSALTGTAEAPVAAVRRALPPMVVGGIVGGLLFGSASGGLWLYQGGQ